MSTAPAPEPRDPESPKNPKSPAGPEQGTKPRNTLVFDDPLSQQSADDADRGWGERAETGGSSSAADLARFLDEKPPHHL
ncbi:MULTISPECIES: hypothetical protein [Streptomyces]|uniref:hypothetical protein n=1 Tax=Streptomyces TaxID=1883 RepID=UPI001E501189|nr:MULTISPECIES: hypothetical protein [Streptomyces]UFQ16185.1 hypothetical protein J2N69_14935 [Streptomyces huasconensis]WCL85789.1 hypothetical protein PPN52_14945 [Streptomyces sp. JCM 35825]